MRSVHENYDQFVEQSISPGVATFNATFGPESEVFSRSMKWEVLAEFGDRIGAAGLRGY